MFESLFSAKGVSGILLHVAPRHVLGFGIVVEEFDTGIEVEILQNVLFQILGLDIRTKGEVGMSEGFRFVGIEIFALQNTEVAAFGNEVVIVDKGGLAGQEREGYRPVGFLELEGESSGEVGRGKEVGNNS